MNWRDMLNGSGLPLSCHPIISFGEKVKRGLSSPSAKRARLGDAFVVGFGIQGALTCRAGAVARGPEDLPTELREFYPRLAANYFEVVACWYESLRIGARGGDVWQRVDSARNRAAYTFRCQSRALPSSGRMGAFALLAGKQRPPALRDGPANGHHSGFARSVLLYQRRGWHRPGRRNICGPNWRATIRPVGGESKGARNFMQEVVGITIARRRPASEQHARMAGALRPGAQPSVRHTPHGEHTIRSRLAVRPPIRSSRRDASQSQRLWSGYARRAADPHQHGVWANTHGSWGLGLLYPKVPSGDRRLQRAGVCASRRKISQDGS